MLNTSLSAVVSDLGLSDNLEGVISSAVVLGAAVGSLSAGHIADSFGPRLAQILNTVPFVVGTVLCCLSPGKHIGFLLGRVVTGIGAPSVKGR